MCCRKCSRPAPRIAVIKITLRSLLESHRPIFALRQRARQQLLRVPSMSSVVRYNHGLALACAHHRISTQELVHRTVPGFAGRSFAVADRAVDHRDSVVPSLGDPCGLAPVHPELRGHAFSDCSSLAWGIQLGQHALLLCADSVCRDHGGGRVVSSALSHETHGQGTVLGSAGYTYRSRNHHPVLGSPAGAAAAGDFLCVLAQATPNRLELTVAG